MSLKTLQVFPTSRSLREFIDSCKDLDTLLPKSITLADFFSNIVFLKDYTLCDKQSQVLYLHQAIVQSDYKKLGVQTQLQYFLSHSEYILRFFQELSQEFQSIKRLKEYDSYALFEDHLTILEEIWDNYQKILETNKKADMTNIPNIAKIYSEYILEYDKIIFYYEGYFSKYEASLIKKVANLVDFEISVAINKFNTKNIEIFKYFGIDVEKGYQYSINLTQSKIVSKEPLTQISTQNVTLEPVDMRLHQIGFIKASIYDLVQSGVSADNIAIVLPDESFAQDIALFDEENYCNFAMGKSIHNEKVYQVVQQIYNFMGSAQEKQKAALEFLEIDSGFIQEVQANWNKKLTRKFLLLTQTYLLECIQAKELVQKVEDTFYYLEKLLLSEEFQVLTKEAWRLILQTLGTVSIDDTYSGKVTVLGVLETRALQYDGVIICDFNEDYVPKRSIKDRYISTALKQKLGLPTPHDRQNLQRYYYERIISQAKKAYICFVDDEQKSVSRYAQDLFASIEVDSQRYNYAQVLYRQNRLESSQQTKSLKATSMIHLEQKKWSASSLKRFLQCQKRYYLYDIYKISEHSTTLKPKSYELGNAVHDALYKYYQKEILRKNKAPTLEQITQYFHIYFGKNPYLDFDLELYMTKLDAFVKKEQERYNQGIRPIMLEQPFSLQYHGYSYTGKIDRVDMHSDGTLEIIDYKTSKNLQVDTLKTYENSNDFQLVLYVLWLEYKYPNTPIIASYYDLYQVRLLHEMVIQEKKQTLKQIQQKLLQPLDIFEPTETLSVCRYCEFQTLCERNN